jgi:hypothetical protein
MRSTQLTRWAVEAGCLLAGLMVLDGGWFLIVFLTLILCIELLCLISVKPENRLQTFLLLLKSPVTPLVAFFLAFLIRSTIP